MKYYLIYSYHDLFMYEFDTELELVKMVNQLKSEYKYDNDFSYKVIYGEELEGVY